MNKSFVLMGVLSVLFFSFSSCGNTKNNPPVITVDSPANNAVVSGSAVRIQASMTDDHDSKVTFYFYIDGTFVGGAYYATAYYDWNTTDTLKTYNANGTHTIKIVAVDSWGDQSDKSITVTVSN